MLRHGNGSVGHGLVRLPSGSSPNGLHRTFAHRLLRKRHRPLRLANCNRALRRGHSINSLELAAGYSVCDAASRWTRILRPRGSRADECTLLRCTPHAMPGWRRSPCCVCSEHGCIQAKGVLQVTIGLIEVSGRSEPISDAIEHKKGPSPLRALRLRLSACVPRDHPISVRNVLLQEANGWQQHVQLGAASRL